MEKRIILVTGANRGIGLAIVKGLSENKEDHILLACRNPELSRLELKGLPENVEMVALDLAKRHVVKQQVAAILAAHPSIDVLINNAGVLHEGDVLSIDEERVDDAMRVNAIGPWELIKAIAPGMVERNYGRIVNMSSGWGSFDSGLEGPFSYSLSKATLNALTMTAARSLPSNVKINSMCPGWVHTRMGGAEAPRSPEEGAKTALWLANLDDDGPTGKFFRDKQEMNW